MKDFARSKNNPTVGHINYESDFVINLSLPDEVGDRDFKIDFYTNQQKVVRFTRHKGVLSPNLRDKGDGRFYAVFRKHGLQPGKLNVKATYVTETNISPDGEMVDVIPEVAQFELVNGAGDIGLNPLIQLTAPQLYPNQGGGNSSMESFLPTIEPAETADTKTIKKTIITLPSAIATFDAENAKLITPNGVVFLGYGGGTYDISEDKLSLIVNWVMEAVEGQYELRIPAGCIVLENGLKNDAVNIAYDVTIAPIVYFIPEITPQAGNVSAEDMKSVVVTLPDKFGYFDSNADPWYNDIYLSYMASGGYKEEKSAKFYADITVADDGRSININWSKFAFESGITYAMNIPKGYIVLENGDKTDSTSVEYTIA